MCWTQGALPHESSKPKASRWCFFLSRIQSWMQSFRALYSKHRAAHFTNDHFLLGFGIIFSIKMRSIFSRLASPSKTGVMKLILFVFLQSVKFSIAVPIISRSQGSRLKGMLVLSWICSKKTTLPTGIRQVYHIDLTLQNIVYSIVNPSFNINVERWNRILH